MYELEVKDMSNNVVGKISLNESVFGVKSNLSVLHEAVVNYLANQRQGTHATKTRGLVSGGGKKPWRQKHTGRARAGSIRSPLWRGGGIVFGPQPRDYSYDLPKRVKRLAFLSAFNEKIKSNEVVVVDNLMVDKPKTKEMIKILNNLGIMNKSVLVVLSEKDDNVILSARNIPNVDVTRVADLNTYNILRYNFLLITKDAIKKIEEIKGS
jgi:large subunit ribosomal protein L4